MVEKIKTLTHVLLTGRAAVLTAVFLFLISFTCLFFATQDRMLAWRLMGVAGVKNSFNDLRAITHSIACVADGVDPYLPGACNAYWRSHPDPLVPFQGLLLNYPPVWLQLKHVGASAATTPWFGVAIICMAFISLWLIFRPQTRTGGVVTMGAVLSPSVLLGMERGNIDLVIFSLLVMTIVFTERLGHIAKQSVRAIGIVALTVLKLYPVVCMALLVRHRRHWALGLATAAVGLGAAWWAADGRFVTVLMNTPKDDWTTFGSLPVLIGLKRWLTGDDTVTTGMSMSGFALSLMAFLCTLVSVLAMKLPRPFPNHLPALEDDLNGNLALAGLCVFCAAFVFGASYDYRLIFLCLALPLLISAYEHAAHDAHRFLAAPVMVVAFLWLSRFTKKIGYVDEILDWTLFSVASTWVFCTLFFRVNSHEVKPA